MINLLLPLWISFAPGTQPTDAAPPDPTDAQDAAPAEPVATPEPVSQPTPAAAPVEPAQDPPALTPVEGPSGPPYYTEADMDRLRERYGVAKDPRIEPRKPKWRCLIPDPTCGFGVEVVATTAYAYRARQGNISVDGAFFDWNSARVAYDLWLNFPAHVQTLGTYKFTRLTLGPKVAIVASDNQDLWGNMGLALRYWFGTEKWSPALEFSSALSFKLVGEDNGLTSTRRSPVGITADIGINIGGWGAIIVGGQYDSPLAREEIPEKFRISAGGQMFVGFRGNILWGVPAAAAVGTHIALQRAAPDQP
ncbi:hypothetical protein DB30_05596 [Enhygromyxa salina]|uniref:Uncharacterized protein n=1 Tax=Enhygromyxa salina TaxID=215803 RepID=A0A0C2D0M3_9BACT|nr:hypothetical protein [Enhygromyxa salina]KIG15400.1 hypothetical protein DB30_05596 [Enhygromyxa salina]